METGPDMAPALPPSLRLLQRLVIVLLVVMIAGFALLIGLLVQRVNGPAPEVPKAIALPDGTEAAAVTQGLGWIGIVTADDRILIYDSLTGALRQEIVLD